MQNILKRLDYLSPPITFYYNNSLKHTSIISGILTIMHYSLVFFVICYYSTELLFHKQSNSSFYKTYLDDPGIFEVSNETFFHYITFKNGFNFDPKAMSVIGLETRPSLILKNNKELTLDHWVYENCTIDFTSKESKKLKIDQYGLCIKKFFNSATKQFSNKNDKGFKYPTIQHGTGNDNSFPYAIILQACQNETKQNSCYPKEKINEYFKEVYSLVMHIQDEYVDVNNYSHPLINYINTFEVGIIQDSVITSNVHFSSTLVHTHKGLVTNSIEEKRGYSYNQVVRGSYERKEEDRILSMMFLWLHNEADVYERKYLKIQDILANISGISTMSSCIFFLLNLVYHSFTVFDNFNNLLINMQTATRPPTSICSDKGLRPPKDTLVLPNFKVIGPIKTKSKFTQTPTTKSKLIFKRTGLNFLKSLKYQFSFNTTNYYRRMINLRKKILSEEKLIKNYIFLNDLVKMHSNSELYDKVQSEGGILSTIVCDEFYDKKDNLKNCSATLELLNPYQHVIKNKTMKL